MGTLEFNGDAVRELFEHARNSKEFRGVYGSAPEPALILVHDQGVYLMSAGIPALPDPHRPKGHKVVYAQGCHPERDDEWWEEARDLVGGDDFAEALPLRLFESIFALELENIRITIKLTATQLTVSYTGGKKKPKKEKVDLRDEVLDFGEF